jgi:hypothetical protein
VETTAKGKGLEDVALVVVPHPIAVDNAPAIRKKADDAMEQLVRTLVGPNEKPTKVRGTQGAAE